MGSFSPSLTDMTTTESPIEVPVRLDFDTHAPDFARALSHLDHAATKELDKVGFDARVGARSGVPAQWMCLLHRHAH